MVEPPITFHLIDPDVAKIVGAALAVMDPWQTLGTSASTLIGMLLEPDQHLRREAIRMDGILVGVVAVRNPWLYGPYLALLAILPGWQGTGIGSVVLRRIEDVTKPNNIWVCVSSFNQAAKRFYERNAFELVGTLPGLLRPDFTELLMRRRII
jgi:diamine N-acetyltransferase